MCIIVPLTLLSLIISRTKPSKEIAKPNHATSKPIVIINNTLIIVSKHLKSFHSNLYFSVMLKNFLIFFIWKFSLSFILYLIILHFDYFVNRFQEKVIRQIAQIFYKIFIVFCAICRSSAPLARTRFSQIKRRLSPSFSFQDMVFVR